MGYSGCLVSGLKLSQGFKRSYEDFLDPRHPEKPMLTHLGIYSLQS